MNKNHTYPRYLNLLKISMPVAAVLSIVHRLSGVLLVMVTPVLIYFFELSLKNPEGFDHMRSLMQSGFIRLVVVVGAWLALHHFFAGIRFLLIDIEVGVERQQARRSAWLVHALAAGCALLVAGWIL
jgi:succinate dehydrogenase / fumarate reductase cytochrome b subunit